MLGGYRFFRARQAATRLEDRCEGQGGRRQFSHVASWSKM
jgi:hypothetical protein